jgi:hypothetical protein
MHKLKLDLEQPLRLLLAWWIDLPLAILLHWIVQITVVQTSLRRCFFLVEGCTLGPILATMLFTSLLFFRNEVRYYVLLGRWNRKEVLNTIETPRMPRFRSFWFLEFLLKQLRIACGIGKRRLRRLRDMDQVFTFINCLIYFRTHDQCLVVSDITFDYEGFVCWWRLLLLNASSTNRRGYLLSRLSWIF